MAARYWMKMTGADCNFSIGWRTTVENMREPAGETQTLEPRPLPATWTVAVAVNPVGSRWRSWVFLYTSNRVRYHEVDDGDKPIA